MLNFYEGICVSSNDINDNVYRSATVPLPNLSSPLYSPRLSILVERAFTRFACERELHLGAIHTRPL